MNSQSQNAPDLAVGKSTSTAVADANKNLNKNPKTDTGDKAVRRRSSNEAIKERDCNCCPHFWGGD